MAALSFVIVKIASILFHIVISPFMVFLVIWLVTNSQREGYLISLLIYSILNIIVIIFRIMGNATPDGLVGFMGASIRSVLTLISIAVYWTIYLIIWGRNFDLAETSAIFK